MSRPILHSWATDPNEAVQVQAALVERLVLSWQGQRISTIGGVDVGLGPDIARAAIVVLRYPDLAPMESVTAEAPLVFPHVPGLLAFREGPAILAAWDKLQLAPDLIMFDGQGIAHPRGIGIASQMGLWLERPTIGVAKSKLYGHHAAPGSKRGDWAELRDERDRQRIIGAVLRSREGVNPLYVSPGHLIDLPTSIEFVLGCCTKYRLPEPTRWAHTCACARRKCRVASGEKLPVQAQPPSLFD